MKVNIYLIARNNGFICRKSDDPQPYIFKFDGIVNQPNIPFYYHLFESDKYINDFISFKKQMFKGNLASNILRPKLFIAVPDDAAFVDRHIFEEFFYKFSAKETYIIKECMLLSKSDSYIAISQTCRMIVLSYIKEKTVKNTLYIENKEYSAEEMKLKINALFTEYEYGNLPVMLNGDNLIKYSEIGELVSPETLLNNYIEISKMKISKSL